eukprot:12882275-Prorocentrum_lima.AAC.1
MEPRFVNGIFLGISECTGDHHWHCRRQGCPVSRLRMTADHQWNKELVRNLKVLPWVTSGDAARQ